MDWSVVGASSITATAVILAVVLTKVVDRWDRQYLHAREDEVAKARHEEWIQRRWWEWKADAYASIIESLWHLLSLDSEALDAIYEDPPQAAPAQGMDHNRSEHYESLRQKADVGAFVVSSEVALALQHYFRATPQYLYEDDFISAVGNGYQAGKECLDTVRVEALRDLGVKPKPPSIGERSEQKN